ncbi:MAG: hypothetical protein DIU80_022345 [Chloroflexota bacterium]|nr:MAG: hypothetical protein DIU80_18875 [Chloroflexota bacterium]
MGRWIGIGLAVIAVLSIAFIVALYMFPEFRVATRDIAVVIAAFFQIISTILTAALLLAVLYAVRAINRTSQNTIIPRIDALAAKVDQLLENGRAIAGNVQDTTATVSTTTGYVAEQVVTPFVRLGGLMAGVRAAAAYLARRSER